MKKLFAIFLLMPSVLFSQDIIQIDSVVPLERFEALKVAKADSIRVISAWDSLCKLLEKNDQSAVRNACLKKLDCSRCGNAIPDIVSVDSFVLFYRSLLNQGWFANMIRGRDFRVSKTKYPDGMDGSYSQLVNKKIIGKVLYVYKRRLPNGIINREYYYFLFVKVNEKYKFLGLHISK